MFLNGLSIIYECDLIAQFIISIRACDIVGGSEKRDGKIRIKNECVIVR